jgi:hypothetical protein
MRENFGAISFSQALIPNELKIICKVYGDIYTPGGYRGEGVPVGINRLDVRHIEPVTSLTGRNGRERAGFHCGSTGRNCSWSVIPSIPLRFMLPPHGRRPVRGAPALGYSHFLPPGGGWRLVEVRSHVFIVRAGRGIICTTCGGASGLRPGERAAADSHHRGLPQKRFEFLEWGLRRRLRLQFVGNQKHIGLGFNGGSACCVPCGVFLSSALCY